MQGMGLIIFLLLVSCIVGLFLKSIYELYVKGNEFYVLLFIIAFLPEYTVLLSLIYKHTHSILMVHVFQYLKEIVIFSSLIVLVFYHKNFLQYKFSLTRLDILFILFISTAFIYLIFQVGSASFVQQLVYFKNILTGAILYFLGRNSVLTFDRLKPLLNLILVITFISFIVGSLEKVTDTHLHSRIGFGDYNMQVHNKEPSGSYGLTWTFQAQYGRKRFGSFFSNPLDYSASMLMGVSVALILFLSSPFRNNRIVYAFLFICAIINIYYAYSRASFVALGLMLLYVAFLLRYYRLILLTIFGIILTGAYLLWFAPKETRYFVEDTLTFRNASSINHVIEWLEGLESIRNNPFGLGLSTSGNIGGVEKDIKVGGENQFIIYGVQLGVLGMSLYILIIFFAIRDSVKAYHLGKDQSDKIIPFIAASTKFGLILPLFTANAEAYGFISMTSWWMVGYSMKYLKSQSHAS